LSLSPLCRFEPKLYTQR